MTTTRPTLAQRPLWRWTVPAAALTVMGLLAIAVARGATTVCPAVYPAPASCAVDARETPALVGALAIVLLGLAAVVVAAALGPERRVGPLRLLVATLGVVAVVAPLWVLGSSGFAADERVLLIVLCCLACVVVTLRTLRR